MSNPYLKRKTFFLFFLSSNSFTILSLNISLCMSSLYTSLWKCKLKSRKKKEKYVSHPFFLTFFHFLSNYLSVLSVWIFTIAYQMLPVAHSVASPDFIIFLSSVHSVERYLHYTFIWIYTFSPLKIRFLLSPFPESYHHLALLKINIIFHIFHFFLHTLSFPSIYFPTQLYASCILLFVLCPYFPSKLHNDLIWRKVYSWFLWRLTALKNWIPLIYFALNKLVNT